MSANKKPGTLPFYLTVDGSKVTIFISSALMAHFHEQFKTNTDPQRDRKKTLEELMRAAYRAGSQNSN